MEYETIRYRLEDGIAILTLHDPARKNAISFSTLAELSDALERVERERSARALLLCGTEEYFCAGGNLSDMDGLKTGLDVYLSAKKTHNVYDKLEALPIPTVAAIAGAAMGGGLEIALACDIRIANEKAKLALSETSLGLIPGGGGTQRLTRAVGVSRALELLMTGRVVRAEEARQIGLVHALVPVGEVYTAGLAMARTLSRRATAALGIVKRAVYGGYGAPPERGMELEARGFEQVFATEDSREGIRAFLEKRSPEYSGQ